MRTPFDAALRALEMEMDALKTAIAETARRRDAAEARHAALVRLVALERGHSARDWQLPATGWLDRSRLETEELLARQRDAEAELGWLRDRALEQQGALSSLEEAARRWAEETARAIERAEQALVDDVIGARHHRRRTRRREAA